MKANAPEKIYISPELDRRWYYPEKVGCYDTEYVKTDAFIKKAEKFIYSALNDGIMGTCNIEDFMRLFKKYMEE